MKVHVEIGGGEALQLSGGVLVYRGRSRAFCSWHEVVSGHEGSPQLGQAQPLTTEFVRCLAGELGIGMPIEVLPDNVLVRTPEVLVWWTPASIRSMFFRDTDPSISALTGKRFPQPPLVWAVSGHQLRLRALTESTRPLADSRLCVAPYFNIDGADGLVCQGTMRSPEDGSIAAIEHWERAFFQSQFTHQTGERKLTSHPGGFAGLWNSLAGRKTFPQDRLVPANETLLDFAKAESH